MWTILFFGNDVGCSASALPLDGTLDPEVAFSAAFHVSSAYAYDVTPFGDCVAATALPSALDCSSGDRVGIRRRNVSWYERVDLHASGMVVRASGVRLQCLSV